MTFCHQLSIVGKAGENTLYGVTIASNRTSAGHKQGSRFTADQRVVLRRASSGYQAKMPIDQGFYLEVKLQQ